MSAEDKKKLAYARTLKLVLLRNPHGKMNWKGDWNPFDSKWKKIPDFLRNWCLSLCQSHPEMQNDELSDWIGFF